MILTNIYVYVRSTEKGAAFSMVANLRLNRIVLKPIFSQHRYYTVLVPVCTGTVPYWYVPHGITTRTTCCKAQKV